MSTAKGDVEKEMTDLAPTWLRGKHSSSWWQLRCTLNEQNVSVMWRTLIKGKHLCTEYSINKDNSPLQEPTDEMEVQDKRLREISKNLYEWIDFFVKDLAARILSMETESKSAWSTIWSITVICLDTDSCPIPYSSNSYSSNRSNLQASVKALIIPLLHSKVFIS